MLRLLVMLVYMGLCRTVLAGAVENSAAQTNQLPELHLAMPGQPVAGILHDEALKIYARHVNELRQLPGVYSVSFSADGLVVETDDPTVLPPDVEGLPLIPIPYGAYAKPSRAPEVSTEPVLESQEPEAECPPKSHFDPIVGRCVRDVSGPELTPGNFLPPPSGVIVLRPGGVREHQNSCPPPFDKVVEQGGWRFCVNPNNPEPIPPLMVPPIAGIPYEEAEQILERHKEELMHLPGVGGFGLGTGGIEVETDNPAVVPPNIEGLPIKTRPRVQRKFLNYTVDQPLRPLHGAAAIGDSFPNGIGTLTGVVLSQGKPWLTFPAYLLDDCEGGTALCSRLDFYSQ